MTQDPGCRAPLYSCLPLPFVLIRYPFPFFPQFLRITPFPLPDTSSYPPCHVGVALVLIFFCLQSAGSYPRETGREQRRERERRWGQEITRPASSCVCLYFHTGKNCLLAFFGPRRILSEGPAGERREQRGHFPFICRGMSHSGQCGGTLQPQRKSHSDTTCELWLSFILEMIPQIAFWFHFPLSPLQKQYTRTDRRTIIGGERERE